MSSTPLPHSFSDHQSRIWMERMEKPEHTPEERKVKPFSFPHNFRQLPDRKSRGKNARQLNGKEHIVYSMYLLGKGLGHKIATRTLRPDC